MIDRKIDEKINRKELSELIKTAEERAAVVSNQSPIIFIGNSGAGKSTSINLLLGCEMSAERALRGGSYLLKVVGKAIAKQGDTVESETLYPEIITSPQDPSMILADCPGIGDNRNITHKICAARGVQYVVASAENVRGLVLVIDYQTITEPKPNNFNLFVATIAELLKLNEKLSDKEEPAIKFLITKIPTACKKVDVDSDIVQLSAELAAAKNQDNTNQLKVLELMRRGQTYMIREDGKGYSSNGNTLLEMGELRDVIIRDLNKLPADSIPKSRFLLLDEEKSKLAESINKQMAFNQLYVLSEMKDDVLAKVSAFESPTPSQKNTQDIQENIRLLQCEIRSLSHDFLFKTKGEIQGFSNAYDNMVKLFTNPLPLISKEIIEQLFKTAAYLTDLGAAISVRFKKDPAVGEIVKMLENLSLLKISLQHQISLPLVTEMQNNNTAIAAALKDVQKLALRSATNLAALENNKSKLIADNARNKKTLKNELAAKQLVVTNMTKKGCPAVPAHPGTEPAMHPSADKPAVNDPGEEPTLISVARAVHPFIQALFNLPDIEKCLPPLLKHRDLIHGITHPDQPGYQHAVNEHNKLVNSCLGWNADFYFNTIDRNCHDHYAKWCNGKGREWVHYNLNNPLHIASVAAIVKFKADLIKYEQDVLTHDKYTKDLQNASAELTAAKELLSKHIISSTIKLAAKNLQISTETANLMMLKSLYIQTIGAKKSLETLLLSPHRLNAIQIYSRLIDKLRIYQHALPANLVNSLEAVSRALTAENIDISAMYKTPDKNASKTRITFDAQHDFDKQLALVNNETENVSLNYACKLEQIIKLSQTLHTCNELNRLDLKNTGIDKLAFAQIFSVLRKLPALHTLDLSGNQLDNESAMALLALIYAHPGLLDVNLEGNPAVSPVILEIIRGILILKLRQEPEIIIQQLDNYLKNCLDSYELLSLVSDGTERREFTTSVVNEQHVAEHVSTSGGLQFTQHLEHAKKTRNILKLKLNLTDEVKRATKAFFNEAKIHLFFNHATSELSKPHAEGNGNDNHWYTNIEIQTLLEHFFNNEADVFVFTPINAEQFNGATLMDNINDRLSQQVYEESQGMQRQNQLILPINLGDRHWVALHINLNDRANPTVTYVDPFGHAIPAEVNRAIRTVFNTIQDDHIITSPLRLQNDGYNCGPWVVEILSRLGRGQPLPAQDFNITEARQAQQLILQHRPAAIPAPVHQ
jgi:GTP-binding protein EngB required for normal cell division